MVSAKVIILGCGGSSGVPLIGCKCDVCTSDHPKNKRSRVSVYLEMADGTKILFDTSPDLRLQALANNIDYVDAIFLTHYHADHLHGLDDVRSFNYNRNSPIDLYCDHVTMEEVKRRFDYAFTPTDTSRGWYKMWLIDHEIKVNDVVQVNGHGVQSFPQIHGKIHSLGFKVGNFVYSTDFNDLPTESFAYLNNLDLWIIDCLGYTSVPTHLNLEKALYWIDYFKPKHAILTHMGHEIEYQSLKSTLPSHIEPGYDGLVINLD